VQSLICARAELLIETQCWLKFKGKVVMFLFLTLPFHSFSILFITQKIKDFWRPKMIFRTRKAVEKSLDPQLAVSFLKKNRIRDSDLQTKPFRISEWIRMVA